MCDPVTHAPLDMRLCLQFVCERRREFVCVCVCVCGVTAIKYF